MNEFNEITNQLNSIDIICDDDIQALLILGQLPKNWKGNITLINGSYGKSKLEFSKVVDMILILEIKKHEEGFFHSSSTLKIESKGRSKNKGIRHNRSKSRNDKSKSKNLKNSWN